MAGEWIAMKLDLWECPQVVRILSALCPHDVRSASAMCPQCVRDMSRRCGIIGALYRTWSLIDRFAVDGILDGYDANVLDETVGMPGWSAALQSVGWLTVESQSLVIPEFESHFGQSAKRRMMDAKRKRTSRQNVSAFCPQNVRTDADEKPTREEKRREEKRIKKKNPLPLLPEILDTEEFRTAWTDWDRHRMEIKKPLTPTSIKQQIAKMAEWGAERSILTIRHTVANGWQGLREPEGDKSPNGQTEAQSQMDNIKAQLKKTDT